MYVNFEKFELSLFIIESRFVGISFEEDCGDGYSPIDSTETEAIFLSKDSAIARLDEFALEDFYENYDIQLDVAEVRLVRYSVNDCDEAERKETIATKNLLPQKEGS